MNIHLSQTGLYIDRGEKQRVNEYLESLRDLGQTLGKDKLTADSRAAVRKNLYDTQPLSRAEIELAREVGEAHEKVEERRERIIERFRKALGA